MVQKKSKTAKKTTSALVSKTKFDRKLDAAKEKEASTNNVKDLIIDEVGDLLSEETNEQLAVKVNKDGAPYEVKEKKENPFGEKKNYSSKLTFGFAATQETIDKIKFLKEITGSKTIEDVEATMLDYFINEWYQKDYKNFLAKNK